MASYVPSDGVAVLHAGERVTPAALLPIDVEIREAWAELLEARQDFTHSPNGKTQHAAMCAEAKVNRLLERRFAAR